MYWLPIVGDLSDDFLRNHHSRFLHKAETEYQKIGKKVQHDRLKSAYATQYYSI